MPLAVNADSLATWFLEPLARLSQRHPVVFELHRDDQDFTAGLLESGTVMGAVTSRATPVAGCRVSALGAMRYEAVATPAFAARWLPDRSVPSTLAHAPLVDFDRRDDLQTPLAPRAAESTTPCRLGTTFPRRTTSPRRCGSGSAGRCCPRFQSQEALDAGELVLLGGPPIDVPLYWQQWNLRSPLLDAIADEIVAEGRRAARPAVTRRTQSSLTRSTILPRV